MKSPLIFCGGLAAGLAAAGIAAVLLSHGVGTAASAATGELLHTEQRFDLVAEASLPEVAPLMGAEKERDWAPGWEPDFLWPRPAEDREGMAFTISHGHGNALWLNTRFDPANGQAQYVYVVPGVMITLITLSLSPRGDQTEVSVTYARTALSQAANAAVQKMAEHDGQAGPEWQSQINAYLKTHRRP